MPVLAALAAQPRRAKLLPAVLASLRPQVDRLHVYLNGWNFVPACVRELADAHVLARENEGAERKLRWADEWQGVYCSTDDDIVYPSDYVATMTAAIERLQGRAIVTAHGRVYLGRPRGVHNVAPASVGHYDRNVTQGRFINHGGTGVMAWDASRVRVPSSFPLKNIADMQVAVWAQRTSTPIWLIPHEAHWFKPLALLDPRGLFRASQVERHARRNEMLRKQGAEKPWRVFETAFGG